MYQNKFLHKQAATPLFDTAKKYLAQLGKGVQDKWNSLDEDTRDALKVAAPSAVIAGTGSWLLGDKNRSVGRKALDSVLWGGGTGSVAFGGTKLAKHLRRVKEEKEKEKERALMQQLALAAKMESREILRDTAGAKNNEARIYLDPNASAKEKARALNSHNPAIGKYGATLDNELRDLASKRLKLSQEHGDTDYLYTSRGLLNTERDRAASEARSQRLFNLLTAMR